MTTRTISTIHEKAVAKALCGVRMSNSGATPFSKGDVIVGKTLIECKTKMKPVESITVQKEWLTTLQEERRGMGLASSALAISFDEGKSSYYIIDQILMKRLLDFLEEENKKGL